MSLPASYSSILSELNREVTKSQPSDVLQFCANWFQTKLEAERVASRSSGDQQMKDTTPPLSAKSFNQPKVGPVPTPSTKKSPPPSMVGAGYTFGGPPRGGNGMELDHVPSPFSEYPPPSGGNGQPSPFGSRTQARDESPSGQPQPAPLSFGNLNSFQTGARSGPPDGGPSSALAGSNRAQAAARAGAGPSGGADTKRDSVASADDSDSDVEDPRDNPNYNPHNNGNTGGIPVAYNLGRRTSVSAESLDPNANTSLPKTIIYKDSAQRGRIEASIRNNLLFRNLDEEQHNDVLNAMKEVTVKKGTEVIVQGAVGDFFYVVEEGTFEVWVRAPPTHTYAGPGNTIATPGEEKKVATYGPGGSFGELALMYNAPRAATVVATSRATMWALDRVTFRSILMEHTSRKRKMYETFLAEVPILASLNTKERAKIADALEEKVYEEGERVVVEGEVGKNFYIIESGKAEVSRRKKNVGTNEEDVLGHLGKGDYFGGE